MAKRTQTEGGGEAVAPPQLTFRNVPDRFKAAKLVANILAHFPPNVRTAILQMALAGDVDRQIELPTTPTAKGNA